MKNIENNAQDLTLVTFRQFTNFIHLLINHGTRLIPHELGLSHMRHTSYTLIHIIRISF